MSWTSEWIVSSVIASIFNQLLQQTPAPLIEAYKVPTALPSRDASKW